MKTALILHGYSSLPNAQREVGARPLNEVVRTQLESSMCRKFIFSAVVATLCAAFPPGSTAQAPSTAPKATSPAAVTRTFKWQKIPQCSFIKDRELKQILRVAASDDSGNPLLVSLDGSPMRARDVPPSMDLYAVMGAKTDILVEEGQRVVFCKVLITGPALISMKQAGMEVHASAVELLP